MCIQRQTICKSGIENTFVTSPVSEAGSNQSEVYIQIIMFTFLFCCAVLILVRVGQGGGRIRISKGGQ